MSQTEKLRLWVVGKVAASGLTQTAIAEQLGVSQTSVSNTLRGHYSMGLRFYLRLAGVCGFDAAEGILHAQGRMVPDWKRETT